MTGLCNDEQTALPFIKIYLVSVGHDKVKVYMADFLFIFSIKSSQCTDKYSKKLFDSDFPSRVLTYQKREVSLPVGYLPAKPKTGDWEMIVTSFHCFQLHGKQMSQSFSYFELINSPRKGTRVRGLYENKKLPEKSFSPETLSSEMTSQSFPVSCFWSRGFDPTGSEISHLSTSFPG